MKKIISVLLIIASLTLILCSCGEDKRIARGTVTDNVYKNESLNITFTAPSGWTFYTDEQLAEMMHISVEMFMDEELFDAEKAASTIDFMAIETATANNINLSVENLKHSGNSKMTVEEYLEKAKTQVNEQMEGIKYTFTDTGKATVSGDEYTTMKASCTFNGVTLTQYFYVRKVNYYMVTITATTNNGKSAASFEAMFS